MMAETTLVAMREGIKAALENRSGVSAMDLRVIVKPDVPKEKIGSVFLPESAKDQKKYGAVKGTVVSVGENAFEEACARSKAFKRPKEGDRIMFGQYAGHRFEGLDGDDYLIMNDEDILGRLEE